MSNTTTINSIVEKITSLPNTKQPLVFNSNAAIKKQSELKELLSNYIVDDSTIITLSAFLQSVNLNIFTEEELRLLSTFNYNFIENKVATSSYEKPRNLNKPYYDLGGKIINIGDRQQFKIRENFKNRHTLHKSLDLEFLAQFIINQV